jgi:uncharacterized protein (TIGR02246 family)
MIRPLVVAAALLAAGCGPSTTADDTDAIKTALRQWPKAFNEERIDDVCGLFADDVVLIYPGTPDRGHDEFCDQMRRNFADPSKSFTYAEPDIREVNVDGDLAAVRLIWTLTVHDAAGRVLETVEEDGVDVFKRQSDGSWKIHVSHAFTRD